MRPPPSPVCPRRPRAKPGDLTFAENDEYFAAAENSAATAIIAGKNVSVRRKKS